MKRKGKKRKGKKARVDGIRERIHLALTLVWILREREDTSIVVTVTCEIMMNYRSEVRGFMRVIA